MIKYRQNSLGFYLGNDVLGGRTSTSLGWDLSFDCRKQRVVAPKFGADGFSCAVWNICPKGYSSARLTHEVDLKIHGMTITAASSLSRT